MCSRAGQRDHPVQQDLGTGIPTSPNVHETACAIHPDARVVYVDNDPIVLAHNRALLATHDGVITIGHDLREPDSVLADPALRELLDLDRPIGLLMVAVLHFVDLAHAPHIVARYVRELPAGSRVAITAACSDGIDPAVVAAVQRVYSGATAPAVFRTRAQIEELFDGLELLPPGMVNCFHTPTTRVLAGSAVKPPA